jgi:hypothetical protein
MGNGWISLKKVNPDGNVEYVINPTQYGEGFNSPNFVVDESGNVYYTQNNLLLEKNNNSTSTILENGLNDPHYFSLQKDGFIYLVDLDGIKRISLEGELEIVAHNLTDVKPMDNPYPEEERNIFNRIYGITLDTHNNVYFAYNGNSRVYKIDNSGKRSEVYFSKGNWYPLGLVWYNGYLIVLEEGHWKNRGPQALRILQINTQGNHKVLAQTGEPHK